MAESWRSGDEYRINYTQRFIVYRVDSNILQKRCSVNTKVIYSGLYTWHSVGTEKNP